MVSQDNRKFGRVPFVRMITIITPKEKAYISQSENLSLGGIFLIKENPLPEGAKGLLKLTIDHGERKRDITSKFRVAHSLPSREGAPGMGIEFIGMAEEDQTFLQQIIEQHLE